MQWWMQAASKSSQGGKFGGGDLEDNYMTLYHTIYPTRESLIIIYCLQNPRSDTEPVLLEQQQWKNNGFAYPPFTLLHQLSGFANL